MRYEVRDMNDNSYFISQISYLGPARSLAKLGMTEEVCKLKIMVYFPYGRL